MLARDQPSKILLLVKTSPYLTPHGSIFIEIGMTVLSTFGPKKRLGPRDARHMRARGW